MPGGVNQQRGDGHDHLVVYGGKELHQVKSNDAGLKPASPPCPYKVGNVCPSVLSRVLMHTTKLVGVEEVEGLAVKLEPVGNHFIH